MMVHSIPNAFSADECDRIIAAIASSPVEEAFLVGHNREKNLRNAELVWIDEVRGMEWAMERLIDVVRKSNTNHYDFDIREFAESPQVASYNASAGSHFSWHSDIGRGRTAQKRKLTLVVQLSNSNSYEGGDLEIMPGAQIFAASRARGCASIFPSYTLHQVTPVVTGIRYSLTVWAHGPAFR